MKSFFSTPLYFRKRAAGEFTEMLPAGEMWSVVIESPNTAKIFAFYIGFNWAGSFADPSKNGGLWIYVDFSSQEKCNDLGTYKVFHLAVPCDTFS